MTTRRDFLAGTALLGLGGASARAARAEDPWGRKFEAALASDPALLGWASAARERLDCPDLAIEGRWPAGLEGTFYRNGPGCHETGGRRLHHWFDGDGMVQAFAMSGGRVRHSGRFVETRKRVAEKEAGRMLWPAFGTAVADPAPLTGPDTVNAANISLLHHAGELLALWEAGSAHLMAPDTLETLGPKAWSSELAGAPFSAHPKVEPDGTLWSFGYALHQGLLALYRIDPAGRVTTVGTIGVKDLGMVHDFAVTARHVVFVLPPLVFERERAEERGTFLDGHVWRPELGVRVLAVRKEDFSQRRWWQLPAGFMFHFGNAWEDGGAIHLDYCLAPDASGLTKTFREIMRGVWSPPTGPTRFAQVTLGQGDAVEQRVASLAAEFPRVAPDVVGRRHRHVYSLAGDPAIRPGERSLGLDRAVRWDTETGDTQEFSYGSGFLPEEHVFVPRAGSRSETDGWLLGTALDLRREATQLAVFDAARLGDGPLAVARLPYPLPLGFHGIYVGA